MHTALQKGRQAGLRIAPTVFGICLELADNTHSKLENVVQAGHNVGLMSATIQAQLEAMNCFSPLSSAGLQVLERIKDPLQTMISRDHFETAYAVLANFLLIVQRAPVIFSQVLSPMSHSLNFPSLEEAGQRQAFNIR